MPISFLLYPQVKCTTPFFYLNIEVLIIYLPRFTFQSQISLPEYFS